MIYLEYDADGFIEVINAEPERSDVPFDELRKTGILLDELPHPETPNGKVARLKVNVADKSLFYEYLDAPVLPPSPPSIEEEVAQLKLDKASLENYVLDLDYRLTLKELGM